MVAAIQTAKTQIAASATRSLGERLLVSVSIGGNQLLSVTNSTSGDATRSLFHFKSLYSNESMRNADDADMYSILHITFSLLILFPL